MQITEKHLFNNLFSLAKTVFFLLEHNVWSKWLVKLHNNLLKRTKIFQPSSFHELRQHCLTDRLKWVFHCWLWVGFVFFVSFSGEYWTPPEVVVVIVCVTILNNYFVSCRLNWDSSFIQISTFWRCAFIRLSNLTHWLVLRGRQTLVDNT